MRRALPNPSTLALAAMLSGCPAPPPAAEQPPVPAAVSDAERAEIVADVQHLLQEVVRGQVARDRLLAGRSWQGAWQRFETHLLADLRRRDPDTALRAEYAFGVVGHAIERGRRADESVRWLDGMLQIERNRLLGLDVP